MSILLERDTEQCLRFHIVKRLFKRLLAFLCKRKPFLNEVGNARRSRYLSLRLAAHGLTFRLRISFLPPLLFNLRGYSLKLQRSEFHLNRRGSVFPIRIVAAWNKLSQYVMDAPSASGF